VTLEFFISGQPRGKQRPRFWNGRAVTPKETREYEEHIAWAAKEAGAKPHDRPCSVFVEATFSIPTSWSKKLKAEALAGLPHTSRPDGDNILKAVLDSLNGVAFKDDSLAYTVSIVKRYGLRQGVSVRVMYD
jgi:Holliday junction resolvase RusA-like endonuclease